MNLVLDADVLSFALKVPADPGLRQLHEKSRCLFDSILTEVNALWVPFPVVIEVLAVIARTTTPGYTGKVLELICDSASEILGYFDGNKQMAELTFDWQDYLSLCLELAQRAVKVAKDMGRDQDIPGFRFARTEVRIGGMDVFVLGYALWRSLALVTNDWSLWYVAWKQGVQAYWLSGLSEHELTRLATGESIAYPRESQE